MHEHNPTAQARHLSLSMVMKIHTLSSKRKEGLTGLGSEHAEVQKKEAKRTHARRVGQEEGEVSVGSHRVHHHAQREERTPGDHHAGRRPRRAWEKFGKLVCVLCDIERC